MSQFLQFVLLGLATGSLYALTAQGLVLVYRGSGVLNLAQGAYAMVGAYAFHRVGAEHDWPTAVRLLIAVGSCALLGALTQLVLMRPLRRASSAVRLVATLGAMFLLLAIANSVYGDTGERVATPLPDNVRHPFGESVNIGEDRLWVMGLALVVTAVLWAVTNSTHFGRLTQAVAENTRAAAALGHSPDTVAAVNWALGAALAGLAGVFVAPILLLQPAVLTFTVLRALAAALVGRFASFWGTLAGALGIGVAESLLARYVAHEGVFRSLTSDDGLLFGAFSAQAVARSVAFLLIVAALAVGGRALPLRGELIDRLPAIGSGRITWPLVAIATAGGAALVLMLPANWATAATITLATAIILLSVVVVTGYAGQVSLAQFAMAGIGAWIAGRLVDAYEWPFPVAAAAAIAACVPVGVLLALPAVRTRGANLTVLTFGLSVCVVELVLTNPSVTGGLAGTRLPPLSLVGLTIDPFAHAGRYAVLVLLALVVVSLAVANVRRGRTGRRLIAVRSNERGAAALGVDVVAMKVGAFGLGAAIAALGGILLAFRQHTVAYAAFGSLPSIHGVLLATIGGVGYVLGAVVGAFLAPGGVGSRLADLLGFGRETLDVVSGVLLLVTLIAHRDGLAHVARRRRPRHTTAPIAVRDDAAPHVAPGSSLTVEHVSVRFGGVTAVDDVSFRAAPGEVLGLIGPNGAGKTTLLDAITGFVRVDAGRVRIGGVDVSEWPPHRRVRAGLGRAFQSLELFDDLTVHENVLVACEQHRIRAWASDLVHPGEMVLTPEARDALDGFGLGDVLDHMPSELPHGRRRLLAMARAVAAAPAVLLLDEPAAGLGEADSAKLGLLIRHAADAGLAVVLVEHDMDLVMSVCDRVLVLDGGRLIAAGRPDEVTANDVVRAAYLGESVPRELAAVS